MYTFRINDYWFWSWFRFWTNAGKFQLLLLLRAVYEEHAIVTGGFPLQRSVMWMLAVFVLSQSTTLNRQWFWRLLCSRNVNVIAVHGVHHDDMSIMHRCLEAYLLFMFVLLMHSGSLVDGILTHWGRDEMNNISQMTFSNIFSSIKMFEFR